MKTMRTDCYIEPFRFREEVRHIPIAEFSKTFDFGIFKLVLSIRIYLK